MTRCLPARARARTATSRPESMQARGTAAALRRWPRGHERRSGCRGDGAAGAWTREGATGRHKRPGIEWANVETRLFTVSDAATAAIRYYDRR